MSSEKPFLASAVGVLFFFIATQPASAQDSTWTLEEVTVTAQKREEGMQSVPIAIDAFDANALEKIGFTELSDLMDKAPALTIGQYPQGSSALTMSIRGIGQVDAVQVAVDPGVGIYLDDVYLARGQGLTVELGELERVEVLRGPQGTLYGRNAVGGAVKFVSAKPTGEFGLKEDLTVGRYGRLRSATYINLPEIAGFSTKLTYLKSDFDGWVDNPGGEDFGVKDADGYRLDLRWQPGDAAVLDYTYDYSDQTGTSFHQQYQYDNFLFPFFSFPLQPEPVSSSWRAVEMPQKDDFTSSGHALTASWDISDRTTLKSISSYRSLEAERLVDSVEAFNLVSVVSDRIDQHQFSQELLLSGSNGDTSLQYTLGALYFRESADSEARALTPNGFLLSFAQPFVAPTEDNLGPWLLSGDVENTSKGIYSNVTWVPDVLEQRLSLTVGLRYSRDERSAGKAGVAPVQTSYDSLDPSVTIDYEWADGILSYVKYAEAYRSGGFNLLNPTLAGFGPEHLESFEVGLKSEWLENRLRVNLALFTQDFSDIQLTFTEVGSSPLNVVTTNAGENRTKGVELDIVYAPIENLVFSARGTYLDAENVNAVDPFTGMPIPGGFKRTFTPERAYNISGEYTFADFGVGRLSAFVDYSYSGEQQQYSGTFEDLRPDYSLVNARLTLADISVGDKSSLSISLWGNNLGDEAYQLYHAFGSAIFAEPRSYGLNVKFVY